jgi:hypothetical protein
MNLHSNGFAFYKRFEIEKHFLNSKPALGCFLFLPQTWPNRPFSFLPPAAWPAPLLSSAHSPARPNCQRHPQPGSRTEELKEDLTESESKEIPIRSLITHEFKVDTR